MNSIRIVQHNPRSTTVQVYNAQVLVKCVHEKHYQVECNLITPIGLVPCTVGRSHLCWHSKQAIGHVLNKEPSDIDWFNKRRDAFWSWAGNSNPMSLVHVEGRQGMCTVANSWAVVQGMLSGMEKAAMDAMQSKGAMK